MTSDARQIAYWERDHGHRTHDHEVVRAFALQRLAFMRGLLDLGRVRNALDVGCGNGFSSYYVQQEIPDLCAVDRSAFMLSRHPLRRSGRLASADVLHLPFSDGQFDVVYGWEVLHHIADPVPAVREMTRVSRRYVVMAEPNPINPAQLAFALWDPEHRWQLRFTRRYMRRIAEQAGLRVLRATGGGWIFPNVTPRFLLPALRALPYSSALGISNWVFGVKRQ